MTTSTISDNQLKTDLPLVGSGNVVRVHQKLEENGKTRIQVFEGLVIAVKHGKGINATFTVRKESGGVGVERIFPLHSPNIAKIEVIDRKKVRRAKLYFIRTAKGKRANLRGIEINKAVKK